MVIAGVILAILLIVPFWFLLPRAGIPAPVALIAFIPLGAILLLWVMAFKRWPDEDVSGRF